MIIRRYGNRVHSVTLDFDPAAMTEVGFRRDNEQQWDVADFEDQYELVREEEITADGTDAVQAEAEKAEGRRHPVHENSQRDERREGRVSGGRGRAYRQPIGECVSRKSECEDTGGTRMVQVVVALSIKMVVMLLVHGMLSDRTVWSGLQPLLEERFTTYAMNRRGREGSGELGLTGWDEQFDDLAAVADAIDAPVHIIAHSFEEPGQDVEAISSSSLHAAVNQEPPFVDVPREVRPPPQVRRRIRGEGLARLHLHWERPRPEVDDHVDLVAGGVAPMKERRLSPSG